MMKTITIAIIGAGPAGNYTAWLLAKAGYDVTIYEEHPEPGLPIQCTGILTSDLQQYLELNEEYIINRMNSVQAFAPNGKMFEAKCNDIIVCRHKFDKYLLKKAIEAGAKLETGTRFITYSNNEIILIKNNKESKRTADILIGADGPASKVSKIINKNINTTFYIGVQATVKGNFEPHKYQVYLGTICPEFFGWVVPENKNQARIGLATKKTPLLYFKKFLEKLGYKEKDLIDRQGGLFPCYNPYLKLQKNNIYLIGDAATTIKSTTGGGIIPSLEAAKTLVECIQEDYKKDLFNKKLKRKKLWLHLVLRRFLDQFSDEDYNKLIEILNQTNAQETFGRYTRDNPLQLLAALIFKHPQLIVFGIRNLYKITFSFFLWVRVIG